MRVAVTGAGGQIGSYLTENLSVTHPAMEVVGICRNAVAGSLLQGTGCVVRVAALTDPVSAASALSDCDAVVHCALATGLPRRARLQNEAMTWSIAQAPTIKKFILLSSVAVYGTCIDHKRNSYRKPRPDDAYGRAKLAQERYALKTAAGPGRRIYVLRLGHVYGPNQAMSRLILHMAQDPLFALPFGGQRLSNAIHLAWLGEAIAWLMTGNADSSVYNLTDAPHQTWRAVFDWHTEAAGLPPVQGLPQARSDELQGGYRSMAQRNLVLRALGEVISAARSTAGRLLFASPVWRELGYQALRVMPEPFEQKAKVRYRAEAVRQDIESIQHSEFVMPEPWLMSDPMPGAYLELPNTSYWDASMQADRKQKLNKWFQNWNLPYGAWIS